MNKHEQNELYKRIYEQSPSGIFIFDLQGIVLSVNQKFSDLVGYSRKELENQNLSKIHMKPEINFLIDQLTQLKNYDTRYIQISFERKNGALLYAHVMLKNMNHNQIQGVISAVQQKNKIIESLINNEERFRQIIQQNFNETIIAVESAQEQKDPYTTGHQNNVAWLSIKIAQELGLLAEQIKGLELAAHVHDIGKIGIPAELLTKPTRLSALEFELIKTHPEIGYNILKGIHFPWPIATIVRQHHERINGSGYPEKLTGEKILLEAKIIAVADTVDAMSSHRPYRLALGINIAIEEIQKGKEILYDSKVVDAFKKIYEENKITLYGG